MERSDSLKAGTVRYSVMFGGEGFLNFWGRDDFAKRPGWKPITGQLIKTIKGVKSEESVRRVADAGINMVWTEFSVGLGPTAEKGSREEAKRFVEICHNHGIKVLLYVQANNVFWQDFFKEIPQAVDWLARDPEGRPVTYLDGAYWFRYYTCINNQGWVGYTRGVIREALVGCQADGIHFDNIETLPRICHCVLCRDKFARYLESSFSEEELAKKLGIRVGQPVLPPREVSSDWASPMDARDPLVREWARFRCNCVTEFLEAAKKLILCLNPNGLLTSNTSNLTVVNKLVAHAMDLGRVGRVQDLLFVETDLVYPRVEHHLGQVRLITNVRTHKWGRSFTGDKPVVASFHRAPREGCGSAMSGPVSVGQSPSEIKLLMAEGLASGGYGSSPVSHEGQILTTDSASESLEAVKAYNEFMRDNEDLYVDTASWANVALFISQPSLAWDFRNVSDRISGFEQTLIQSHIPFDTITDDMLETNLGSYDVLILPGALCLSDRQIEVIQRYVRNGGGLISTGPTSLCTEDLESRGDYGLRGVFGMAYGERQGGKVDREWKVDCGYGNGKVIFFPGAPDRGTGAVWPLLPGGWVELSEAVRSLTALPVYVQAPPTVYVNLLRQENGTQRSIHLVNYAATRVHGIGLRIPCADGRRLVTIGLLSPDVEGTKDLSWKEDDNGIALVVPCIEVYDVVRLSFAGSPEESPRQA